MDKRLRGYIESSIDGQLRRWKERRLPDVEWIRETVPISSTKDLALGIMVGALKAISLAIVVLSPIPLSREEEAEAEETIVTMLKRRLPELVENIERELGR